MAITSTPPPLTECPRCRERLETGILLAPRGIYWDKKVRWSILGADPIISMLSSFKTPHAEASRCRTCGMVLFTAPFPQGWLIK